ncbi:hypothetical protein [Citrobacter portucalensis]|uniref:hypothetical protein n=1 Tax=Citrobacter portucalensis TaxID=1639133 RepID=UPI003F199FB3
MRENTGGAESLPAATDPESGQGYMPIARNFHVGIIGPAPRDCAKCRCWVGTARWQLMAVESSAPIEY